MRLKDRVAVVTGGASGIGAALCRRFAAEGARGVVVADLDGAGAERVAAEFGGLGVATDVADEAQVRCLVELATARFGPIDLFFSNAGIGAGVGSGDGGVGGPFASNQDWQRSWDVNLMAHVYAARALLPAMLARGEGYLCSTASAAGLLIDVGGHAYSVTKHAAVGFAEWLSVAYGDRGIRVSCLCPQGVNTPMLAAAASAFGAAHLTVGAIEPAEVAEAVVRGIADETFLILPHPEVREFMQRKAGDPDRWLRGMRRLRAAVFGRGPATH
jgi:NAD(P)-dependent dehydrogenase (short-subunit alcohol dehydrogenase family)